MRVFGNKSSRVDSYFVCLIALAGSNFAAAADFDCSPLDPRASVSKEQEGKVNGAVETLYKLAKAQGSVEGKLKEQIQNLQQGAPASDQLTIRLRTLWLFCGMVANARDMTTERKVQLLREMEKEAPATTLKDSKPSRPFPNVGTKPEKDQDDSKLALGGRELDSIIQNGSVLKTATGAKLRIESHLRSGANAVLFLATNVSTDETVVVKVFLTGLAPGSPAWEQFNQEQQTAKSLKHRNIVKILETGLADGYPFTVMEFFRGRSLQDWLQTHDRIPGPDILSVAKQIADAIDFAHSRGIVHRDIKPSNILLQPDPQGLVALSDFGVARVFGALQRRITAVGRKELVGSPAYVAPEAFEGREISKPSDIYSFGVVLYEMIAGKIPFDEFQGVYAILHAKVSQDAPAIRKYRKDVPKKTAIRLAQTLSRDPDKRPKSARAVLSGIEDEISHL